jgi:hypothetical protein
MLIYENFFLKMCLWLWFAYLICIPKECV